MSFILYMQDNPTLILTIYCFYKRNFLHFSSVFLYFWEEHLSDFHLFVWRIFKVCLVLLLLFVSIIHKFSFWYKQMTRGLSRNMKFLIWRSYNWIKRCHCVLYSGQLYQKVILGQSPTNEQLQSNPFPVTGLFLCLWFSDVFRVYRKNQWHEIG